MANELRGLLWKGETFDFIEQTLLPHEEKWVSTTDWRVVVDAIKRLAIRGAPAIGVSGAFAAVLAWRECRNNPELWNEWLTAIETARPTAVNLRWAVKRIRDCSTGKTTDEMESVITEEAIAIAHEDEQMCEQMAEHGVELVGQGSKALTHCNTGFLVTYGFGTALGVLRKAYDLGKLEHVYACEARPLCQGARLTMWELYKLGIPGTLLSDSAAGRLFQEGKVDFVMLGADRIAGNGDTANKIGTFNLAVLANRFNVPFYVVAPTSTFDVFIQSGAEIPIEYRDRKEVITCMGHPHADKNADAFNPAFDVTPNELITAIITEKGIIKPPYELSKWVTS